MSTAIVTFDDLGRHLDGIPSHAVRLIGGCDLNSLTEALTVGVRPARPVVHLNAATHARGGAGGVVRGATGDLVRIVTTRWPYLWGVDLSDVRDDALGRAHLSVRLAGMARRLPGLDTHWAADASLRLARGHCPCTPRTPPAVAWPQLVLAISPAGLTLVAPLPDEADVATLAALEWLATSAAVAVVLLAREVPRPGSHFDRVLFGARQVAGHATPEVTRDHASAAVLADVEVEGRPHPGSAAERRLYELIRADPELAPLFGFNRVAHEVTRTQARIDILWSEGRVAVEVDGPEHRGSARYRADRHRDYELLCAGYRVLRLTNEEVTEDAGLALSKIRDVVRSSRFEGP